MTLRAAFEAAWPPLALLAMAIVAWHIGVVWTEAPPYLMPAPYAVASRAIANAGQLARALVVTGAGAVGGFLASLIVGVSLGLAFSQIAPLRRAAYPFALFLQTVPIVAIAPLIIRWFGYGLGSVIVVAFIVSLFPIVANTTQGLMSVPAPLLDLFALYRANRWQTLRLLRVPNALPSIVAGARVAAGLSVIGAIVGEFAAGYGSRTWLGLGYWITMHSGQLKTDALFADILCATLLGLVLFGVVELAGKWVLRKHPPMG